MAFLNYKDTDNFIRITLPISIHDHASDHASDYASEGVNEGVSEGVGTQLAPSWHPVVKISIN